MEPRSGFTNPRIDLTRVDFPAPFGPIIPTNNPCSTLTFTLSKAGRGPKLKAGMTLAIEPMINMGTSAVRVLDDKWTVVTADGLPSAHFEHTVLVTKDEPEVLTWRKKTLLK